MESSVLAVSRDGEHRFSKTITEVITLRSGLGVADDAHAGETVQHRSRVAADPTQRNLRQVHLLHVDLFDELEALGCIWVPRTGPISRRRDVARSSRRRSVASSRTQVPG